MEIETEAHKSPEYLSIGVVGWLAFALAIALLFCTLAVVVYSILLGPHTRGRLHILTKSTIRDLQVSLGHFRTEHNRKPIMSDPAILLRSEGMIIYALLGDKCEANPRGVMFADFSMAREGRPGLTGNDQAPPDSVALVDAWGEKYYLIIESRIDNRFPNPERLPGASGRSIVSAPEFILASSLVFSSGPDKNPSTWDDNVCSWR